jgi:hypothetical protein
MQDKQTFRTKTGTCTITPDEIVLTRLGHRVSSAVVGNSIIRILAIYGIMGGVLLALGVRVLLHGDTGPGVLLLLWGALVVGNVVVSRNNSAAAMVKRSAIRKVTAHRPRFPLTRGYFTVFFEEEGRLRKRLIMLPGSMHGGGEEYRRAEAMMATVGLLHARQ